MESGGRGFRNLLVWKEAMALAVDVHRLSDGFPRSEDYALKSQIRRAGYSIPCNIAEGSARTTPKDFMAYLAIAAGSLRELETQLDIVEAVGYAVPAEVEGTRTRAERVGRMLTALITSIRKKQQRGHA